MSPTDDIPQTRDLRPVHDVLPTLYPSVPVTRRKNRHWLYDPSGELLAMDADMDKCLKRLADRELSAVIAVIDGATYLLAIRQINLRKDP